MKYIYEREKGEERERVRHAFYRAQSEPVLITTTVTSNAAFAQNMDLFIVHQDSMNSSQDPALQARYLVGIRSASQGWSGTRDHFHIDEPVGWHPSAPNNENETQTQQTVQEKVLLCAAEFKQEQIIDGDRHIELEKAEHGECTGKSAASAPAVVHQPANSCSVDQLVCSGNSCLPGVAEVWKEGLALPTSVQEVAPGDRVLCLDEWTGSIGYIPITNVHITDANQASWVMVTLEDGSVQQMTSDHPVYPYAHGQPCLCVTACGLKPGYHMLPVLKLVHVPVKAVDHVEPDTASILVDMNPKKASLSVTDNRRYTVLTRCGSERGSQSYMAVGAVEPPGGKDVIYRNTFLDVVTEGPGVLRRCSSEPALHHTAMQNAIQNGTQKAMQIATQNATKNATRNVTQNATQSESIVSSSHISSSHISSSHMSSACSSGDASIVMWDQDVCKVSFVTALNAKHLPSAGSHLHEATKCSPCLFQARQSKQQWDPCWKGALCDHCHINAVHPKRPYAKKKLRL